MKINLKKLFFAPAFLLAGVVYAQDKKVLTLDEAIDLSLKNSHQLKSDSAKIEEATAALKEATEKRLPNATVSGSYIRLNTANIDLKTQGNTD